MADWMEDDGSDVGLLDVDAVHEHVSCGLNSQDTKSGYDRQLSEDSNKTARLDTPTDSQCQCVCSQCHTFDAQYTAIGIFTPTCDSMLPATEEVTMNFRCFDCCRRGTKCW